MHLKCTRLLKGVLLAVISVHIANGRRVCFKEQSDNSKCFTPIRASLNERPSQFVSGDCCLFSNSMYYADTDASEAKIRFLGVQCSLCMKNQTAYKNVTNPCEGKVCPRGKVCRDKGNGRTKCVCHGCHGDRAYQPVCGTNGETYDNECALKRKACREGRPNVEVAYEGRCRTGCADVVCRRNRTCMIDQYQKAYCVACVDCSKYARKGGPVCGADGLQYDSSCHLRMETCRQGKTIGEAYNGKCIANATCDIITCDMTSDSFFDPSVKLIKKKCVQDAAGRPRCVTCSCEGSDVSRKGSWSTIVCGSDNKTYMDYCSLKNQMCRTKTFIDVRHPGPCTGDVLLAPQDEQTPSRGSSKPCDQDDVTMYYVTMKHFVGILKNDFGIEVTPPKNKRRKFRDKIILVKTLMKSMSKKWIKINQQ